MERVTLLFPDEANHRYAIDAAGGDRKWRTVIDQTDTGQSDKLRLHAGDFGRDLSHIRIRFTDAPGSSVASLAEVRVGGVDSARGEARPGRLTGTVTGTPGSYGANPACAREAAFDGRPDTYFDAPALNGAWVGIDLGPNNTVRARAVAFARRFQQGNTTFPSRMIGGRFQGSNSADFRDAVGLFKITEAPAPGKLTTVPVDPNQPFRHIRYLSPDGGSGNAAEIRILK